MTYTERQSKLHLKYLNKRLRLLKEQLVTSLDSDVKYFEGAIAEVKEGIKLLKQYIKEADEGGNND